MNIVYGKPQKGGGNFGDDMNIFLWPELFGNNIFEEKDNISFLGIGTMLSDDEVYCREWWNTNKVVFGTGVRSNAKCLLIDNSYDLFFLRGPLSQGYLGVGEYVTDAAYCFVMSSHYPELKNTPKTHKIGLIPYFRSIDLVNWDKIASKSDFHMISPCTDNRRTALDVLKEIASCEYIITEAMHGAIFADILRIPWSRFNFSTYKFEQANVADFKWMDWMFSMKMNHSPYPTIPLTCKLNNAVYRLSNGFFEFKYLFEKRIEKKLITEFKKYPFKWQLSDEKVFYDKVETLKKQIDKFKNKYTA